MLLFCPLNHRFVEEIIGNNIMEMKVDIMKIKDLQNIVYNTVYVYKENLQEVNGH